MIVYSEDPKQHLERMLVVFECLREHGLKLKPCKCDLFKSEIIYLAHHVTKDGVKPSHKNVASILECPVPKIFTDIQSFMGAVGHYRRFIKGFAKIAVPLYDLTSGENKDKKSEPVTLTPEALEAFQTLKDKCVQAPGKGWVQSCSRSKMMDITIPLHLPVEHSQKPSKGTTLTNKSS